MTELANPFHAGEIEAQERVGLMGLGARVAPFIRDYMPDQHREFFSMLPFLVVSAADSSGRPWVTIIEGEEGFVSSPDPKHLKLTTKVDAQDPLAAAFEEGVDIGMVGIELAARRRNRMTGHLRATAGGYEIKVQQSFGNCPQYINKRPWHRAEKSAGPAQDGSVLTEQQMNQIRAADTMFIGSGQRDAQDQPSNGYDASHRGGAAGFVEVIDGTHLRIPDYAGNNFFNTIGNLLVNPSVALLFVDFKSGGLLHITGRASIDWEPEARSTLGTQRYIDVTIAEVRERSGALSLRWDPEGEPVRQLVLSERVKESDEITSFYFTPLDGRPLAPFKPGQHLPLELRLMPPIGAVKRSYSLSAPYQRDAYRLSIKREDKGVVSTAFHKGLNIGDVIEARSPSGDFTLPEGDGPLVLISAGVGITPLFAMFAHIAAHQPERPVWFLHSARNKAVHAMGDAVRGLASENRRVQIHYSQPNDGDVLGQDFDVRGRITPQDLLELKPDPQTQYLLCGPAGFVADLTAGLESQGVPEGFIHFETF